MSFLLFGFYFLPENPSLASFVVRLTWKVV